ncbi:MAG: hypothetical protein LBR05_00935 [Azoarcus sp.]|jgi:hypothetical protein|nr:hypothetical protein [Azoarcus sp.]
MTYATKAESAIARLCEVAQRGTGQAQIVADFLLAWWNADECGGFDLTDLWAVDAEIAVDMMMVISTIRCKRCYPDALGFETEFNAIVQRWRPHLLQKEARHG